MHDQTTADDAGHKPRQETWTPLRVQVVALCFLLNMLDGADLLIMSFVAPLLSAEWHIPPESLGYIFSASLAGMAVGCLFVAPLADYFGRKRMILLALLSVSVAMVFSSMSASVPEMVVARFFVGVGVGTIGVSMTAMAAEYAPASHAGFAVGFVQAGWPLGSIITAFTTISLIESHGWAVMLFGIGVVSLVLFGLVFCCLPESLALLVRRQPKGALVRINRLRGKLGMAPMAELPSMPKEARRIPITLLFAEGRFYRSVLLWTAVTLGYFTLYFAISWIPKLAVQAGLAVEDAILAGASYNVGAFLGTTFVGLLAVRYPLNRVTALFQLTAAGVLMVFGGISMPVAATLTAAVFVGIFVNGGFNGFWGLAAALYPTNIRSTGIGWALGFGRIGAVLGPLVGGYLIGANLPMTAIFAVYAVPMVISAFICSLLKIDFKKADAK